MSDLLDLIQKMRESAVLGKSSGATGQMLGCESYRLTMTGNSLAYLEELAESQAKRIAELEVEVAALRVDAGRYRWLRDVGDETWAPMSKRDPSGRVGAKEIDAAIDAAKKQQ